MRRPLVLLLVTSLLSFAACASSSGSSSSPSRPATQTMGSADVGTITVTNSTTADVSHLTASVDAVWRIMPSVFDSLGVPITTMDVASHTIGNQGYKLRGRLGKVSLSRYLDCGNTQIGPNADSYDVYLSVVSTVVAEGTAGAKLSTTVDAKARPITYNQAYSNCASKGGIEIRIADLVKARLAK
jgi:hypothetical protein